MKPLDPDVVESWIFFFRLQCVVVYGICFIGDWRGMAKATLHFALYLGALLCILATGLVPGTLSDPIILVMSILWQLLVRDPHGFCAFCKDFSLALVNLFRGVVVVW